MRKNAKLSLPRLLEKVILTSISLIIPKVKQKLQLLNLPQSVLGWLLGGLFLRCIIALWLLPGYDEGYYYLYSQHLDWSYFDHPVLVALTTGFGIWLTGIVSPFTLRLGTLILYTGSLLLLYFTSARLFDIKAAKLTLAIATVIPIFQVGFGVVTLPDSPLIFFWSASLCCAAYEFFPPSNHPYRPSYRLAILGVLIGLTCLSKYHGFLIGIALVAFCLTSPRHRCALFSHWTGLGLGLFILTLFPLWFWNFQHHWVSFRFQFFHRFDPEPGVPQSGYNPLNAFLVFLTGIGLLFPTIGFPLWWVSFRSLLGQISARFKIFKTIKVDPSLLQKQLFILWVSLPLMLGMTILGGDRQILVTWPMPGFWSATLLLGYYAARWEKRSPRWVYRWLRGTGIAVSSLLLLLLLHVVTGTFLKSSQNAFLGGFLTPQSDASTELIDIQQLREGFAQSPILNSALQDATFAFSNAYYLGGLIDLALRPIKAIPVTCFSYDIRGFAFWPNTDQWVGKDALYITLKRFHEMPQLTEEFSSFFHHFKEIGTVPIRRGGVVVDVFYVYKAQTLLKPYVSPRNVFLDILPQFDRSDS